LHWASAGADLGATPNPNALVVRELAVCLLWRWAIAFPAEVAAVFADGRRLAAMLEAPHCIMGRSPPVSLSTDGLALVVAALAAIKVHRPPADLAAAHTQVKQMLVRWAGDGSKAAATTAGEGLGTGVSTAAKLAVLIAQHPAVTPPAKPMLHALLQWAYVAQVLAPSPPTAAAGVVSHLREVGNLARKLWNTVAAVESSASMALIQLLTMLSGEPEPSIALIAIACTVPHTLIATGTTYAATDSSVTDEQRALVLKRMLHWVQWPSTGAATKSSTTKTSSSGVAGDDFQPELWLGELLFACGTHKKWIGMCKFIATQTIPIAEAVRLGANRTSALELFAQVLCNRTCVGQHYVGGVRQLELLINEMKAEQAVLMAKFKAVTAAARPPSATAVAAAVAAAGAGIGSTGVGAGAANGNSSSNSVNDSGDRQVVVSNFVKCVASVQTLNKLARTLMHKFKGNALARLLQSVLCSVFPLEDMCIWTCLLRCWMEPVDM
jgi:hypothetical protein